MLLYPSEWKGEEEYNYTSSENRKGNDEYNDIRERIHKKGI